MNQANFIEELKINQYLTIKLEAGYKEDLGPAISIFVNKEKVVSFYLYELSLDYFLDLINKWIKKNYNLNIIPPKYEDLMLTVLSRLNDIKEPKAMRAYKREMNKKLVKFRKESHLKDNLLVIGGLILFSFNLWIFIFYALPFLIL